MVESYNEAQDSKSCFWKTVNIYRHDGRLYIKRLIIFRLSFLSVMLHRIYLSDTDCQHSHPWNFISLILKGGYLEYTPKGSKYYSAPSILYRPADWIHRLEVDETKAPVITMVITGKKIRNWGFVTPKGWIPWRQYKNSGTCE